MMKLETPVIKELPAMHVAYLSYKGNYIGSGEVFKSLIEQLMAWAGPKGLMNEQARLFAAYEDDPFNTAPDDMTLQICLTIPEATQPEGDVKTKPFPTGKYAVMQAELSAAPEYGDAWNSIMDFAKEQNLALDLNRPCYEFYMNNPETDPEGKHIVQICLSVK